MMRYIILILFFVVSPAVIHSCNEGPQFAEMRSVSDRLSAGAIDDSGEVPPDSGNDDLVPVPNLPTATFRANYEVSCNDPAKQSITVDLTDSPKYNYTDAEITFSGQFCPQKVDQLHVLLVLDFSGSMGLHRDGNNGLHPGNDPQVGNGCGRLQAIQSLLDMIYQQKNPEDEIFVGVLPFAGRVIEDFVIPFGEISEFDKNLSKDDVCRYVVQNRDDAIDPENPGGLANDRPWGRVDASTNYKAAFKGANGMLADIQGRKVVYMISDGYPTSGGKDPIAASIEAGEEFRSESTNLTLNAVLLGQETDEARELLDYVAGSPNRVRQVVSAGQLADEISIFPPPQLNAESIEAQVSLTNATWEGGSISSFDLVDDGLWIYESDLIKFNLFEVHTEIEFAVGVLGEEGSYFEHRITIDFVNGEEKTEVALRD